MGKNKVAGSKGWRWWWFRITPRIDVGIRVVGVGGRVCDTRKLDVGGSTTRMGRRRKRGAFVLGKETKGGEGRVVRDRRSDLGY